MADSEYATVIHKHTYSEVTLQSEDPDSDMGIVSDEVKRFKSESWQEHQRRALGYAVDHIEGSYDDVEIINKRKKSTLRGKVEQAATPKGAAEALAEYLEFALVDQEENAPVVREAPDGHAVVEWPSGPFEWALDFACGSVIGSSALGSHSPSKFDVSAVNEGVHLEVEKSSAVAFWPEEG